MESNLSKRRAVCFFDGGVRPQHAIAAGAAVIFVGNDEVAYAARFLPHEHRNNVAEYAGLIVGLELALELGYRDVKAIGDSELVVRHVLDQYACRAAHLKPLLARVHELGRQFDRVRIEEAPKTPRASGKGPLRRRNSNTRADELAGICMDDRADMRDVKIANQAPFLTVDEIEEAFHERERQDVP